MSLTLLGPGFESAPVVVPIDDLLQRGCSIRRVGRAIIAISSLLLFSINGPARAADESSNPASNTPPTISAIDDQEISANTSAGPLTFTIGDLETPPKRLVLAASSSNPTLVPAGNIVFGGKGRKRTVTVTPAADQSGSAVITVTVSDPKRATASEQFLLTVDPLGGDFTPEQRAYLLTVAPTVTLDRLVYESPETIAASVVYRSITQRDSSDAVLYLVSSETMDVEQVPLINSDTTMRITAASLAIQIVGEGAPPNVGDNLLQIKPGEAVLAVASYPITDPTFPFQEMVSADFALIYDPNFKTSPYKLIPGVALQANEADATVNGKSLATFATLPGAYAIGQAPINELLFAPHSEEQLAEFLQITGGTIIDQIGSDPLPEWVTVQVTPPAGIQKYLPQFRDMYGDSSTLVCSRPEGLAIYAYGLQLRLEGYQVALDARLYSHSDDATREDSLASAFEGGEAGVSGFALTEAFSDPVFGVREMWANMAMWDADLQGHWNPDGSSIKLGIMDMGLASNDDWRAPCDTCLPISLDPIWHGTGVFSIAGGMLNNGLGTVGTGGQVVVPKTYCMSAYDYVAHVSENITQAVDDGADIVNCSWGYPCRFLLSLGTENACTTGSRIALLAKLKGFKALTCALTLIDPVKFASLCVDYIELDAAFTAFLITETRGAMEKAVDHATENGVPVVASAGNKIERSDLPTALQPFVTDEDLANADIDEWQIIPGVIADVICAGAADDMSSTYYRNEEYFGASVDIWAPVYCNVFAPPDSDPNHAQPAQYDTGFGGTSAAAPYISGIIANMMAINPSLHPHRATDAERANIVANLTYLLTSTAYQPGFAEPDGTIVLPLPDSLGITGDLAAGMNQRRNLVNANKAWLAAAAGHIPDVAGLGFDTDNGHQSNLYYSVVGGGDDIGDSTDPAVAHPLYAHDYPPYDSATDEISFIWPEKPIGTVAIDKDYFKWETPPGVDATKMYRQKLTVTVPDYPKSLPWLTYWHGAKTTGSGTLSYTFYTPWLASPEQYDFLLSTPQYTDTPYRIDLTDYEEATIPLYDEYDTPPVSNDTAATGTGVGGVWTKLSSLPAGGFESAAWVVNFPTAPKTLTLHNGGDVDYFNLSCPPDAIPDLADDCAPILTLRFLPYDPNIHISVVNPVTGAVIKEGRGCDVITLFKRDYGAGWGATPLTFKVESFSETLHTYSISARLSVPIASFCCCWKTIVNQDFGPIAPIDITLPTSGCTAEPGFAVLEGSRVLRQLQQPVYKVAPSLTDSEGRMRTPRTFLIQHVPPVGTTSAEFWLSAFLGHDRDFGGYDQSLRMDLFSVANCTWEAGVISYKGTVQVIYDPAGPAPIPAPYKVGDLDLYVNDLPEGSYFLALTYFKPDYRANDDLTWIGDSVDLVLSQYSIFDTSPSVQDEIAGSSAAEVIIGPDADNLLKP